MKQRSSNLLKKLRSRKGFNIAEMLVAVVLVTLVSLCMVYAVSISVRQYLKAVRRSESQELYVNLEEILSNELKYTEKVTLKAGSDEVDTFFSPSYAIHNAPTRLVALDREGNEANQGYLALGDTVGDVPEYNKLLGEASYPHDLWAKANIVCNQNAGGTNAESFTVSLSIGYENTTLINGKEFQVHALNAPAIQ